MTLKNRFILGAVAASVLAMTCSCSDYVGKEQNHALFNKAQTCKKNHKYAEAVKAYEEFLLICPKSAKTHLELATIFSDSVGDYTSAIYHYRKYLELSRLSASDQQDIRKSIEACRRRENEVYMQENGLDLRGGNANADTVSALRNERDAMQKKLVEVIKENKALKSELANAGTAKKSAIADEASSSVKTGGETVAVIKDGSTTYVVEPGDTLSRISRKVYGNASSYKLILEANKNIGDGSRIKVGQKLIIPPAPSK